MYSGGGRIFCRKLTGRIFGWKWPEIAVVESSSLSEIDRWSNLLPELLGRMGEFCESSVEIFRFRAVCRSWRSSIPVHFSSPTLKIPHPYSQSQEDDDYELDPITVERSIIYRLELLSSSESFLLRVEGGGVRLLTPLTGSPLRFLEFFQCRRPLNLLDFRISEYCREYSSSCFFRMAFSSSNPGPNETAVGIPKTASEIQQGKLFFFKSGEWSLLNQKNDKWFWDHAEGGGAEDDYFVDVITYKAKFYALKLDGCVLLIDPQSKEISQFAPPIQIQGDISYRIRRFVYSYSLGCLLLVDISFNYDRSRFTFGGLYKLDEEEHKWNRIQSLGDEALFVSQYSTFSVSSPSDFFTYTKNCIYFYENPFLMIFNLEDPTKLLFFNTRDMYF